MFPQKNVYVEALSPSVAVFGDGASREIIKVKWGHKGDPMGLVSLPEKTPERSLAHSSHTHAGERPWEEAREGHQL